jgi:hypothetical protein
MPSPAADRRRVPARTPTPPAPRHDGSCNWPRPEARAARTILLFHIISARPCKQPRMVRTFLKVHMVRTFLKVHSGLGLCIHCGVEVTESSTNKQHHHRNPRSSPPATAPPRIVPLHQQRQTALEGR